MPPHPLDCLRLLKEKKVLIFKFWSANIRISDATD